VARRVRNYAGKKIQAPKASCFKGTTAAASIGKKTVAEVITLDKEES